MGGLGRGRVGREIRAEATGDQAVPRGEKQDGAPHEGYEQARRVTAALPQAFGNLAARAGFFVFSVIISLLFSLSI